MDVFVAASTCTISDESCKANALPISGLILNRFKTILVAIRWCSAISDRAIYCDSNRCDCDYFWRPLSQVHCIGTFGNPCEILMTFLGKTHRDPSYFAQAAVSLESKPGPLALTRWGPKFLAGKVFRQILTLLENSSPIFLQHKVLFLPRCGHFPARKMAAGHRPRLRERSWISPPRPSQPS